MKSKRRANPLREYRRLMREIREIYDPFTARHCPTCETPCCVQPSRVTPLDVSLALGVGHTFPHLGDAPHAPAVAYSSFRLSLPMAADDADAAPPCEYLHEHRCTFPDDLRPFGCTQFICGPMHAHLPEAALRRLKRLVRQLEDAHDALLRAVS